MRGRAYIAVGIILLEGCATYTELQPRPPIEPVENGFVWLRDGGEFFVAYQNEGYRVRFPAPPSDNFCIVLRTPPKSVLPSSLTREDASGRLGERISDQLPGNDSVSVYQIDRSSPSYSWLLEKRNTDVPLLVRYRYVPRWRLTFENKRPEYELALKGCLADRSTYNAINPVFNLEGVDLDRERADLRRTHDRALGLDKDLRELASLFPDNIRGSRDTAYLQYLAIATDLAKELEFQDANDAVLSIFQRERQTRSAPRQFMAAAPAMTEFLRQESRFPVRIREKARELFAGHLDKVTRFYSDLVLEKNDLDSVESVEPLVELATVCGTPSTGMLGQLAEFIDRFNGESHALRTFERERQRIESKLSSNDGVLSARELAVVGEEARDAGDRLPAVRSALIERYRQAPCVRLLTAELRQARGWASAAEALCDRGARVLEDVDRNAWSSAESGMIELSRQDDWSAYPLLDAEKVRLIRRADTEVFARVRSAARKRGEAFIARHEHTFNDVATLYSDSAFIPSYQFRFSPAGSDEVARKRSQVRQELDRMRDVEFPEAAIKSIYRDFQANIRDKGVERARAIVEHGKHYRGSDKQVKGLVSECDANAAKTIASAKTYRKVYALPVATHQGKSEYLVRLSLKIPSNAQFPVFDINVKLPEEVAARANREQWYKSITVNKRPLKNEGRFRITAPTASNNYESLISPVPVDKNGSNIVEVRFTHPGSTVFEISAMAQVPIIRKN